MPPSVSQPPRNRHRPRRPAQQPRPAHLSTSTTVNEGATADAVVPSASLEQAPPPNANRAAYFSDVKFQDFVDRGLLDSELKARIPFEVCTIVQAQTLEPILKGEDVFGQAKTGTGKTLAFLVPALQKVFQHPPPAATIPILVLSPTRELALQIHGEVEKLLAGTQYRAGYVIGGTNMKQEISRLSNGRCDVLVATPGRLADHLKTTSLKARFTMLQTFIMDEADRLLDSGFKPQLMEIIATLPPANERQTLMFSATVSKEVLNIAKAALRDKYCFITTLTENEDNTHQHIEQHYLISNLEDQHSVTLYLLERAFASNPQSKFIIFYPTARGAGIAYDIFNAMPLLKVPKFEIHSRLSQSRRESNKKAFTESKMGGILFSSDVSARGLDIPGVTAVYQVGLPSSAEQYVHRLGRTGRAGSDLTGYGVLILATFEQAFLRQKEMTGLPLKPHPDQDVVRDMSMSELQAAKHDITRALTLVDLQAKAQAYTAFMGYYNGSLKMLNWNKAQLISQSNAYAWGSLNYPPTDGKLLPPPISQKAVTMMGLRGLPGLNVVDDRQLKHGQRTDAKRTIVHI